MMLLPRVVGKNLRFSKEYEDTIISFICSNLDYTTTADTFGLQIVGNYGTGSLTSCRFSRSFRVGLPFSL